MLPENQGKNSMGVYKTISMFAETCRDGIGDSPIYTLSREDKEYKGEILPSFFKLYLELEDPTEYRVATELVCGLKHWETLCASPVLKPYLEEMRKELQLKIASMGLSKVISEAKSGKNKYQAAKYLAESGYLPEKRTVAAKKKKETIKTHLKDEYSKDLARITSHH